MASLQRMVDSSRGVGVVVRNIISLIFERGRKPLSLPFTPILYQFTIKEEEKRKEAEWVWGRCCGTSSGINAVVQ